MTRFALFSTCACLALLGACTDATTGGSSTPSLSGSPASSPTAAADVKNSTLISPVVQEKYKTFSANQQLKVEGTIGPDVIGTGQSTAFSNGIPVNGSTFKPLTNIVNAYYEGSQPKSSVSDVTIDFNPRDAVYSIKVNTANIVADVRMQDPQHRTIYQQSIVPTLPNYKYVESGKGKNTLAPNGNTTTNEINTIFVRDVGTGAGQTQYVTIAGFVTQAYNEKEVIRSSTPGSVTVGVDFDTNIARSVFAYGINTAYKDIPKSGSATYTGDMFAHVIITPQNFNTGNDLRSIVGTSSTTVDFGSGKLNLTLAGNVVGFVGDTRAFAATGAMNIFKPVQDTETSLFTGAITNWSFGAYNAATGGIAVPTAASTIEGGFFGPKAEEIGGAFRIIGSRPDERIDFLGAFTGKKN